MLDFAYFASNSLIRSHPVYLATLEELISQFLSYMVDATEKFRLLLPDVIDFADCRPVEETGKMYGGT